MRDDVDELKVAAFCFAFGALIFLLAVVLASYLGVLDG